MAQPVLEIKGLSRSFKMGGLLFGTNIKAVDNVSFTLPGDKPQIMSIVGESGSGKTTLAHMILRLLEPSAGEILLDGLPLSSFNKRKGKRRFLKRVQPVFQNPFTAFSMRRPVDAYLYETAINLDMASSRKEARALIADVLQSVGLDIGHVTGKYSNQFSGGELQRIAIARALISRPQLIVADEPVAMIDASMRMNIVNLFLKLKEEYKVNFIYITHDLSTAYYVSDYIAAMYRGNLIEFGKAKAILNEPAHPYTQLLLDSIPIIGKKWELQSTLPDAEIKPNELTGCKFAARCPLAKPECHTAFPDLVKIAKEHSVLCFNYDKSKKESM